MSSGFCTCSDHNKVEQSTKAFHFCLDGCDCSKVKQLNQLPKTISQSISLNISEFIIPSPLSFGPGFQEKPFQPPRA